MRRIWVATENGEVRAFVWAEDKDGALADSHVEPGWDVTVTEWSRVPRELRMGRDPSTLVGREIKTAALTWDVDDAGPKVPGARRRGTPQPR